MDIVVIIMAVIMAVAGVAGFVMEHGTGGKEESKDTTKNKD